MNWISEAAYAAINMCLTTWLTVVNHAVRRVNFFSFVCDSSNLGALVASTTAADLHDPQWIVSSYPHGALFVYRLVVNHAVRRVNFFSFVCDSSNLGALVASTTAADLHDPQWIVSSYPHGALFVYRLYVEQNG
ncbi:hypothetical protein KRP22_007235 [Phytophthora ramorum]|nr:hypothetical protein KRP22_4753 [Phytophthora ramorum]